MRPAVTAPSVAGARRADPRAAVAVRRRAVLAGATPAAAQAVIKPIGPTTPVVAQARRHAGQGAADRARDRQHQRLLPDGVADLRRHRTFDLNTETASFTSDYAVEPSVGVDVGAFVRVWKGLAAGVAFTSYSDSRDIEIEASLPHPLKFNSPRPITGTAAGDHEETAAHLQVAYIVPVGRKMSAVIFGGPSFFTVKQSVVTAVQRRDEYPYDEATFTGATVATEEESKTGFNVGADVGYYFTKNVGVGGIVRFSAATTTFSLGDVDAGGALVGGGLRLRF